MNLAQSAYRRSTATQWTRIDLLVSLYTAMQRTLDAGAFALEHGDAATALGCTLRAQKLLLGLLDGIKPALNEEPSDVRRLLIYCNRCLSTPTAEAWRDAAQIIATLRSAFEGIQDEARALEQVGEIPPLDATVPKAVVA